MNRKIKFILLDALVSIIATLCAFYIRFEFTIPYEFLTVFYILVPLFASIQITTFHFSGMYNRIWRYTSLFDLYAIVLSVLVAFFISTFVLTIVIGGVLYPRSVLLLYFFFNILFTTSSRIFVRIYYSHYKDQLFVDKPRSKKILLLIGAGKTGEKITRDILTNSRHQYKIAGFIDDDSRKKGALIHGKKVFCGLNDLSNLNVKYDELLITAPSCTGDQMRRIVDICKATGKKYKTMPGLDELIDKEISMALVRDVSYSDLLGRQEAKLDMVSIEKLLKGKRVLITGAGGSIGSELVKQCLSFEPAEIICLDFNEEKIYDLDQYKDSISSNIIFKTVLASITNKIELEKIFSENYPQIVFHAAAYKHVPIQENHPWSAVNTNLAGTLHLAELSDKYSTDKFVLVSTDKAVNPVNVMGATKRAAERLIQSINFSSKTTYMAVRFGNVLGSSGSVIPNFQKQINKGGPLTITHPEMTRYFMSIKEASQLILQCGALGNDAEVFLLEMGKPIKILQMAKDLIRLSGLEPEVDIPIVYTGLRPGEKLYEELKLFNEKKVATTHKKILILKDDKPHIQWDLFKQSIITLLDASKSLDTNKIRLLLRQLIPTYRSDNFVDVSEKHPKVDLQMKVEA